MIFFDSTPAKPAHDARFHHFHILHCGAVRFGLHLRDTTSRHLGSSTDSALKQPAVTYSDLDCGSDPSQHAGRHDQLCDGQGCAPPSRALDRPPATIWHTHADIVMGSGHWRRAVLGGRHTSPSLGCVPGLDDRRKTWKIPRSCLPHRSIVKTCWLAANF